MTPICYLYDGCDTCRKAKKWLAARGLEVRFRPIRETPPSLAELRTMLAAQGGELRRLCNTSSKDYREQGMKELLASDPAPATVFARLRATGNLVKRPFLILGERGLVGFQEDEWRAFFAGS